MNDKQKILASEHRKVAAKIRRLMPCPVHNCNPTRMRRESFIRQCGEFRRWALHFRVSFYRPEGCPQQNLSMCLACKTGKNIAEGRPFDRPKYITWMKKSEVKG